ncbi:hypothetical protein [Nocardioides seonyuensis]|uniref:hypothetical protein n=1 Tax=Nocardioides seonyuensis TaxID=2518371 RepID=UPI001ABDCF66|nr:hypothetical protein [Nocardioides seonyuensis]
MTTTTTSLSTSSTTTRDAGIRHSLVRPFLLTDAATTAVNGLAYVVGAAWLADWFGAPADLQRGLGAFLLAFGVGVALLAVRRPVPRRGVLALVVLNEAWVVASLAYAAMGDLTALGRGWVVLQAFIVAAFAAGQLWFARRG